MTSPSPLVEVSPDVWVQTSRRYAALSTVIRGDDGACVVIDPNWDADELASIPAGMRALGLTCGLGLATHVHYDHVLWHPDLEAHTDTPTPRYASRWTVWAHENRRDEFLAPLIGDLPPELIEIAGRLIEIPGGRAPDEVPDPAAPHVLRDLPPAYALPWSGRDIVLHEHDAHAPAHVAVEVVDLGVLVCGDLGSDIELPMPDEANPDLGAYLQGLDRVAVVAARCSVLIPGHGTPANDPLARIDADRRYLDDLITRGDSDDPRVDLPDMHELHEANQARAAAMRNGE